MIGDENTDELPEEDFRGTYSPAPPTSQQVAAAIGKKNSYRPWHHPVKQVVRIQQWAFLTRRLIRDRAVSSPTLRYFTLPGPDLLDVRVLSDVCSPLDVKIEYFGFDTSYEKSSNPDGDPSQEGAWLNAESALRQSGRVGAGALILPDRLEDLALEASQASSQLRQRAPFDVINIDACDHLAYRPDGRNHNTFDALQALLRHQITCRTPWLLFITTRVEPTLLGGPQQAFQRAINENLAMAGDFGQKLAEALQADHSKLGAAINAAWSKEGINFLKIYSVGLAKFLLQFFHSQPSLPANVELASCCAYRVHGDSPDMLALAFRITPDAVRVFSPNTGGAAIIPNLEPQRASRVAARVTKLRDLDQDLENDATVRDEAISGTIALLSAASYDVDGWKSWLSKHERRPMNVP